MITAQDIREKVFDKARIGGYDMPAVDDFLEEIADELAAAQKENSVLKSKMKVLVDKIEQYRANEEALNLAVLSAQKLAVQIESDARARANDMIAEAEKKANDTVGGISALADAEEQRLASAKEETAKFLAEAQAMCQAQLEKLAMYGIGAVPPQAEAEEAPAEETVVEEAAPEISIDDAFDAIVSKKSAQAANRQRKLESTQPFTF